MNAFPADVTMLTTADDGPRDPAKCQAIVIHTNQGPETGRIESLLAYMQDEWRGVSYNVVVGADGRIGRSNDDAFIPWSAGYTANRRGLHVCALGYAEQSRAQWLDPAALLDGLARVLAGWSRAYGIPLVQISADELRAGKRGVCGHVDTAHAWRETDHTDPGVYFPYDDVLARARKLLDPPKEVPPVTGFPVYPSLVPGSEWRGTVAEFVQQIDRKIEDIHARVLPAVLDRLADLQAALDRIEGTK